MILLYTDNSSDHFSKDNDTMKAQLPDGTIVEAEKLIEPIGQFTHWYMNRNNEPRYLIIRNANEQAYMFNEDVNSALTAALASGRFMICVFTIDAAVNEAERVCHLHRVSHNFPYDAFDFVKTEIAKNLDNEYKPPTKLQLADFVNQGMPEGAIPVDEQGREISIKEVDQLPAEGTPVTVIPAAALPDNAMPVIPVGEPRPLDQAPDLQIHNAAKNDALINQINAMNARAEADGIITEAEPPKANVVDPHAEDEILVAHDPLAQAASSDAGG